MSPARELAPGTIVRGTREYKLVVKVAEGGFGQVWKAHASEGQTPGEHGAVAYALKFATGELGARALESEHRIASGLASRVHTGTVPVHELIPGEPPCLVLSWIEGETFRAVLDSATDGDGRALAARDLLEVAQTVARVHGAGIVHGDLKPENVLVGSETRVGCVALPRRTWLLDFGLAHVTRARRLERSLSASLGTTAGLEGGTLAYLPPEAVKGAEPSSAGDVYALGVMLHEVLLGRRPDKARELSSLGLPEEVTEVLRNALAFEPADRYRDARGLAAALDEIAPSLVVAGARRRARVLGRWVKAGLAAFFVTLRYVSVAALLTLYVSIAVSGITVHPGVLALFLLFLMLHAAVRWEGPETNAEASLRRTGQVVDVFSPWRKKRR